ncbi:hypothetical protein EMA8858_04037 [Emticicia aquatica]|uniref:Seryl-tRNA synthetase n=1 Tax=Emticicia aquatica TaxID=1681835 RepID=A0ABN8EXS5_9BACT|nr:hypothetical protein [Emticicia aquatica]CAH0997902.1 hypothetical protein EMA8858_04037 [Emticicia aquatica]
MKKYSLYILTIVLLSLMPTLLKAESNATFADKTKKAESAEANVLISRLNEIKAMDKSKMTFQEKKQLRKEVRTLKTNIAQIGGGVYLSVGAIIVILLLLILLL